jgi:hypothetical protein
MRFPPQRNTTSTSSGDNLGQTIIVYNTHGQSSRIEAWKPQ